jgi:anti-anti-sigma factor
LEEALRLELDADTDVLLDLTAVSFIDSSGLNAIVTAARMADSRGRTMTLHPVMTRQPRGLCDIAKIHSPVPMSG